MDFWNTILGNNLAHVLISTLPDLVENSKKKEQYTQLLPYKKVQEWINEGIAEGERYIDAIDLKNGMLVIMEK